MTVGRCRIGMRRLIGSYDWDAAVKAYRLEHNQAAATHGEVYELIPRSSQRLRAGVGFATG
jgi:hypothetical protein